MFHNAVLTEENVHKLKWFHDITSWQGYCKYLGSSDSKYVKRPKFGFNYHEFNPIAVDNEISVEEEEQEE